jgi:anti-sigma factor RsiW
MHNCKANREALIALALKPPDRTQSLPAELETCATCREEYAALRNALRIADQTKQSTLPAENFWAGYQARLRQRLEAGSQSAVPSPAFEKRPSARLRDLFTSSVRVPIPLAAALLLFLVASFAFALNSRRPIAPPQPIVVTKTVAVSVPQETVRERVITRVVYRERDRRQSSRANINAIAARRNEPAETQISLVGFKPTNEVKLTIIKGSYRDEK